MKIIVFLAIFLFSATAAFSQEEQDTLNINTDFNKHKILVYGSFGYAGSVYQGIERDFIHRNYSLASALEVKYAYFFTPAWGVSLGAGLSQFAAKGTLNITDVVAGYDDPIPFDATGQRFFDLHYKASDLVEQQRIWALEVPLQAHYVHRLSERNSIFSGLGVKGYFPFISAKSTFPQGEGTLTTRGYEDFTGAWYDGPPHFGTRELRGTPAKVKLKTAVDIIADVGLTTRISQNCVLYIGLYGSHGLMDIRPDVANRKDFITPEHGERFSVNSLLAYDVRSGYNNYIDNNNLNWAKVNKNWSRWQFGVKVGLHFDVGKNRKKSVSRPYTPDSERNPVIVRDTVQIVYVYNIVPSDIMDNDNLTSGERENILSLVEALSSSKILFDIDSDVPKIDDTGFIASSTAVLQREPSLRLLIEGYTCDLGREAHNRDLALRRANAIKDLFVSQGVNPSQVRVAGYTVNDPESRRNIRETSREGHRAVIFRIVKE